MARLPAYFHAGLCGPLLAWGVAVSAAGAEPVRSAIQAPPAALQAAYDCLDVREDSQRLACLDSKVRALKAAEAQGQLTVIDRAQAREVRRQAFGLSLPAFSIFSRGPKEEGVDKVALDVAGVSSTPSGRWLFRTRQGPIWEQTDDDPARNPHPGSRLEVERGFMGNFFCSVDGQRAVRCIRDR